MMMYYRFPILFAIITIGLLGVVGNRDRRDLALALSNSHSNPTVTKSIAQASTTGKLKSTSPSASNSTYDRYMRAGYEAFDNKNYQAAIENFQKALAERPNDIYARQAIQNSETLLKNEQAKNNPSSDWWWLSLGAGLAFVVGGGVFFFSGLLRRSPDWEREEQELAESESDCEPEEKFSLNSLPSEKSQNLFGEANSKTKTGDDDSSIPLQTPTRLPNLDIINELVKDLQEPDPKKRRKAIWELAQKGDSRAMKPLVDLMIDSDSQERSLILEALSQISIRTLKPMNQALALSLQDKNPQVRKNAIRDLTRIYDLMSQISQMLRHAMDDSDVEVQETAKWALNQLNLQMTPTRLDLLPMKQNETMP
ncbi:tetratricopeptide repeat protein [Pleurocapsa sp. PCC 7327]|uniref:HEAT repeat domain-containing protein n=1 Tax=Pleurocapsa sp. PCC 7327 TaxID=118163 RepID=UPI00029FCB85|nr:HEAT repeat domain-containing protein [Pleurocapsa sp. PCC 7327]AFY77299.1 tetratricopeptide repeat protein [Pleurocapsa sp. PCC 7327]